LTFGCFDMPQAGSVCGSPRNRHLCRLIWRPFRKKIGPRHDLLAPNGARHTQAKKRPAFSRGRL
jgi:hypothetical protein